MTISGDVDIYDRLIMIDNSDLLGVEGNIQWHSGSTDEITDGIINIEGDWTFHSSTLCDLSDAASTNTVHFIGAQGSTIYSNDATAAFNNVIMNKAPPPNDKVSVTGAQVLEIKGILTIEDGELILLTDVNAGGL